MAGGKRVRIYISEHDRAPGRHEPLWEALLNDLRNHGAAGVTVFRGMAGFGAHSHVHMARLADVLPDLPIVIEWVDDSSRVDRLLPDVLQMVQTGTITSEDVEVVKHVPRAAAPPLPEEDI